MRVSGWHEIRLGDMVEITKGNSYRSVDLGPSATALVTLKSFERGGGYRHDGLKAFTGQYKPEQVVNPGEIVIALTDVTQAAELVGRPAKVPSSLDFKTLVASVDAGIVRPVSDQIDSQFLYYLLLSPQLKDWTYAHTTGTTVLHLNPNAIKAFAASIPPLSEQREIASALSALDDKIELNRRMNTTLEAMARALFQSWFVDFDPVHAKAEGRQPVGMDAETATLFPDSFEDSVLGPIPKGWTLKAVSEVIAVDPKRTLPKASPAKYLDMKNLPTEGHLAKETIVRPYQSGAKYRNGDTLFARITPCLENGKTGFVDFLTEGEVGWGSTEFIVLDPLPPLPKEFGYLLARSTLFREFAIQNMTGTSGRQRVPAESFGQFFIAVPPAGVSHSFGDIAQGLFALINRNGREARRLELLRDSLIPVLLSGELRIGTVAA
jgi:type I restriction enzyme S subunit